MKKLHRHGKISDFACNDLLRLYEVLDNVYDEYLDRTSKKSKDEQGGLYKRPTVVKADHKSQKALRHKKNVEANCIRKLEIKNRKRIKTINEKIEMENRKRPIKKSDCESYERIKRDFFSQQKSAPKDKETLKSML